MAVQYVATLAAYAAMVGGVFAIFAVLNRRPPSWLLRWRSLAGSKHRSARALSVAICYLVLLIIFGLPAVFLDRLHLLPEIVSKNAATWVAIATFSQIATAGISSMFERSPGDEPEDWLTWNTSTGNEPQVVAPPERS
jgi:hypothetical protein